MMKVDPWLDCCRRRLDLGEFLRVAAEWLAAWLCVFGSLILVVKLFVPSLWPHVLWIAGIAIPVMYFAWRRSDHRRHSRSDGAILLDRKLKTGGLLLALADSPNAQWERQLPADQRRWNEALPRIRPTRFGRLILLPLAFTIGACFAPLHEAKTDSKTSRRPRIAAVDELPAMLEDLKNADALPPEEVAHLREEIDKLIEDSNDSPLTYEKWERIDTLRNRMQNRLNERYRTVQTAQQAARRLSQASKTRDKSLTPEQKQQLEQDIARALKGINDLKQLTHTTPSPEGGKSISKSPSNNGKTKQSGSKTQSLNPEAVKTQDRKTVAAQSSTDKTQRPAAKTSAGTSPDRKKSAATKTAASKAPRTKSTHPGRPEKTAAKSSTLGKSTTPSRTTNKTPATKTTGTGTTKAKSTAVKTPSADSLIGKTSASKTRSAKTPASKKTASSAVPKTGAPRSPEPQIRKTAAGTKSPVSKTPTASKTAARKTGVQNTKSGASIEGKTLPAGKTPPLGKSLSISTKSTSAKQASKSSPQSGNIKLPEKLSDLSPEMIAQFAKMMKTGELRLPEDPKQQEELLRQAQKLLEREGDKLAELQKRYGRQIAEALRNRQSDARLPFDPMSSYPGGSGTLPGGDATNAKHSETPDGSGKVNFRDIVLPPGFLDMKKNEIVSVTGRAPKVKSTKPTTNQQAPFTGSDSSGESFKRRHRPRHRGLVKRYFQNQKR